MVWDARAETVGWTLPTYVPGTTWNKAVLVADPGGKEGATLMTAQAMQLMEVVNTLTPRAITEPSPGGE